MKVSICSCTYFCTSIKFLVWNLLFLSTKPLYALNAVLTCVLFLSSLFTRPCFRLLYSLKSIAHSVAQTRRSMFGTFHLKRPVTLLVGDNRYLSKPLSQRRSDRKRRTPGEYSCSLTVSYLSCPF